MGQGTRTLLDMTVWIMRRPEDDIAAELEASSGPLAGVRLAVKDNVDVGGVPTTAACPEYAYVPDQDAPAVAALRAAGAVVVGKTNLDQFATGLVGTRSPYGAVSDSRRPEYISGGSSSGSAVAVATGQADIAIGTDTAGSGRVPAGLQGIVGIKPTVGVISTEGVVPACESYDCVTIFAPSLTTANAAMAAMGAAAGPRLWPANTRLAAPPQPTIAVPRELPALDEVWCNAFRGAVDDLRAAGATIIEIDLTPFLLPRSCCTRARWSASVMPRWASSSTPTPRHRWIPLLHRSFPVHAISRRIAWSTTAPRCSAYASRP